MAVKAGNILHLGGANVLVDRLQTAGPGNLNIPTETIYELGNYKSLGQVRDIPDLSFAMESYDVSTEIEALLLAVDPSDATKSPYDPALSAPIDIRSVFKAGLGAADAYAAFNSVGMPYLVLEQLQYRFGLRDDARQTATLRGDSIYYNPGHTYVENTAGSGSAGQQISTAKPAYSVDERGITRRVLNVTAGRKRLVYGVDYTEAYGTVTAGAAITTLTLLAPVLAGAVIAVMYSSPTPGAFPQALHAPVSAARPSAIRGRDIGVYLGGFDPTQPFLNRLTGVQAANVDWRVNLQRDEEFGNYHVVAQDFDVPTTTGSVQIKPSDPAYLQALMQRISGAANALKSATANTAPPIPLDIVLFSPTDGSLLKRLSVGDAQFTMPGFQARVQQKLDVTINFASVTGQLLVYGPPSATAGAAAGSAGVAPANL